MSETYSTTLSKICEFPKCKAVATFQSLVHDGDEIDTLRQKFESTGWVNKPVDDNDHQGRDFCPEHANAEWPQTEKLAPDV